MTNTKILNQYFLQFSDTHLRAVKCGSGESVREITKRFNEFLTGQNAPILATTFQVGRLMSKIYIKRNTRVTSHYLVNIV